MDEVFKNNSTPQCGAAFCSLLFHGVKNQEDGMKKIQKALCVAFAGLTMFTGATGAVKADTQEIPVYDAENHTAFITQKTAEWFSEEDYLANLTLAVNGTQSSTPLDIVICLDRSGSMDMQNIFSDGTHKASCPCLNQEHFYLYPVKAAGEEPPPLTFAESGNDYEKVYENQDGTITVYNAEQEKWVRLDTENPAHFYYEFGDEKGYQTPTVLAAYHFKKVDGAYIRISRWNIADMRKKDKAGVWVHGNTQEGCYGRWEEAKAAILNFTAAVLKEGDNRVALVPFSLRDSTMADSLNNITPLYRDWLLSQRGNGSWLQGMAVDGQNTLSGTYQSIVPFTGNNGEMEVMLGNLFTTANTDYVYGLSMAYNLIAGRQENTERKAVVVFLSDGNPYSTSTYYADNAAGSIASFCNHDTYISLLAKAISGKEDVTETGPYAPQHLWGGTGRYQRHDIEEKYLLKENGVPVGVPGLGAQLVTVSYMVNEESCMNRLRNMATDEISYIEIPAESTASTSDLLTQRLIDTVLVPGGREAVLKDEISQYFRVDKSRLQELLGDRYDQVTILESEKDGNPIQTISWEIGDIYECLSSDAPQITLPLILKEEYRNVLQKTYYPTNADTDPVPDLYDPKQGPKGKENGAKLYYTDPDNELHYTTIGTPKLPVTPNVVPTASPFPSATPVPRPTPTATPAPSNAPEASPTPFPKASPAPTPNTSQPKTGDNSSPILWAVFLSIAVCGIVILILYKKTQKNKG